MVVHEIVPAEFVLRKIIFVIAHAVLTYEIRLVKVGHFVACYIPFAAVGTFGVRYSRTIVCAPYNVVILTDEQCPLGGFIIHLIAVPRKSASDARCAECVDALLKQRGQFLCRCRVEVVYRFLYFL